MRTVRGPALLLAVARRRTVRGLAALLLAIASLSACAGEPLAPLPVQAAPPASAVPAPAASAGVAATIAPSSRAPLRRTTTPAPPPATTRTTATTTPAAPPASSSRPSTCFGAVRYDLNLQDTVLDLLPSMCFRVGGVLRLQGIGPGLVTAAPEGLTSQTYEAGVVDLRFVRPGTVTVTIPQEDGTHAITVVVID